MNNSIIKEDNNFSFDKASKNIINNHQNNTYIFTDNNSNNQYDNNYFSIMSKNIHINKDINKKLCSTNSIKDKENMLKTKEDVKAILNKKNNKYFDLSTFSNNSQSLTNNNNLIIFYFEIYKFTFWLRNYFKELYPDLKLLLIIEVNDNKETQEKIFLNYSNPKENGYTPLMNKYQKLKKVHFFNFKINVKTLFKHVLNPSIVNDKNTNLDNDTINFLITNYPVKLNFHVHSYVNLKMLSVCSTHVYFYLKQNKENTKFSFYKNMYILYLNKKAGNIQFNFVYKFLNELNINSNNNNKINKFNSISKNLNNNYLVHNLNKNNDLVLHFLFSNNCSIKILEEQWDGLFKYEKIENVYIKDNNYFTKHNFNFIKDKHVVNVNEEINTNKQYIELNDCYNLNKKKLKSNNFDTITNSNTFEINVIEEINKSKNICLERLIEMLSITTKRYETYYVLNIITNQHLNSELVLNDSNRLIKLKEELIKLLKLFVNNNNTHLYDKILLPFLFTTLLIAFFKSPRKKTIKNNIIDEDVLTTNASNSNRKNIHYLDKNSVSSNKSNSLSKIKMLKNTKNTIKNNNTSNTSDLLKLKRCSSSYKLSSSNNNIINIENNSKLLIEVFDISMNILEISNVYEVTASCMAFIHEFFENDNVLIISENNQKQYYIISNYFLNLVICSISKHTLISNLFISMFSYQSIIQPITSIIYKIFNNNLIFNNKRIKNNNIVKIHSKPIPNQLIDMLTNDNNKNKIKMLFKYQDCNIKIICKMLNILSKLTKTKHLYYIQEIFPLNKLKELLLVYNKTLWGDIHISILNFTRNMLTSEFKDNDVVCLSKINQLNDIEIFELLDFLITCIVLIKKKVFYLEYTKMLNIFLNVLYSINNICNTLLSVTYPKNNNKISLFIINNKLLDHLIDILSYTYNNKMFSSIDDVLDDPVLNIDTKVYIMRTAYHCLNLVKTYNKIYNINLVSTIIITLFNMK